MSCSSMDYTKKSLYHGVSDMIGVGMSVAMVTRVRVGEGWDREITDELVVRYGKVSSRLVPEDVDRKLLPQFHPSVFTTDIEVMPGDSGSAVFAFQIGKPVIIGVMHSSPSMGFMLSDETVGYIARIDKVFEAIQGLEKG